MRVFLLAFSLFLPLLASAGPAPYYQWQSKADGTSRRCAGLSATAGALISGRFGLPALTLRVAAWRRLGTPFMA
jgi:hypothetical protein